MSFVRFLFIPNTAQLLCFYVCVFLCYVNGESSLRPSPLYMAETWLKIFTMYLFLSLLDITIIPDDFDSIYPDDIRVKTVKVVVMMPKCSRSAVTNIVDFILTEGNGR